ncbi:MAG: membrane integrity-associated transporter subunit PqiC [Tateyamaria sp.]
MKYLNVLAGAALLFLAACGGLPDRYAVVPPAVTDRITIAFRSVEIREVSLPAYAAADEIAVLNADGTLVTQDGPLWADSPERAVALELVRNLSQLSGARVASDPWPFEAFPDARVDVRFETFVADARGAFRVAGQYFVAVEDGRRERSGFFDLSVPFDPEGGLAAIAGARGQAVLDVAEVLASEGLR